MAEPALAKLPSENDTPIGFKVPSEWLPRADKIAAALSRPGLTPVTRTEVLRLALGRGLDVLEEETPAPKPRGKR